MGNPAMLASYGLQRHLSSGRILPFSTHSGHTRIARTTVSPGTSLETGLVQK